MRLKILFVYPHIDGRDRCGESEPINLEGKIDYYYGWIDVVPPLMSEKPRRDFKAYEHPGADTIYQCPAGKLLSREFYNYNPQRNGYYSYAMNSCLELDGNCHWWDSQGCTKPMPSFLKTTMIKNPTRVVLLFDQLLDPQFGYDGKLENKDAGKHCGAYPRDFSVRHRKGNQAGGNILYCGLNVNWTSSVWKEDWPEDLYTPPRHDPDWFPYR